MADIAGTPLESVVITEVESILSREPFGLGREEKRGLVSRLLRHLIASHRDRCVPYARFLDAVGYEPQEDESLESLPFLPVRVFKDHQLRSVPEESVVRQLTSSGTTGQQVSRIFLDRQTATFQTKALVRIMQEVVGRKRLPMIILDSRNLLANRRSFSARGAGVLGMANFGRDHFYALDEEMKLDQAGLTQFLEGHQGERILLFGFTFLVWQHFYKALREGGRALRRTVDLSRGILIHSGGWKSLIDEEVDNVTFKASLKDACGLSDIFNFYGMAEQVGSIYLECREGHLHAPACSEIIVRDADDWSIAPRGSTGVIEVLSVLPWSYPGNVLLTEDLGAILGEDDCPCGRLGTWFRIEGRVPKAEVRGCSDTHAADWSQA